MTETVLRRTANRTLQALHPVDRSPRLHERGDEHFDGVQRQRAREGTVALDLFQHALAALARQPVLEALHSPQLKAGFTAGLGRAVFVRLKP